jgi:hypothetical protein
MEESSPIYTTTKLVTAKKNFVVVSSRDYPCRVRGVCSARRRLENASPPGGMSRARGLRGIPRTDRRIQRHEILDTRGDCYLYVTADTGFQSTEQGGCFT